MALKRTLAGDDLTSAQPYQGDPKRVRVTPDEEPDVHSSEASISELRSTSSDAGRARSSSMSSIDPSDMEEEEEEESDSSVSSSSEESDGSESESGEDEITKITTQQKPNISAAGIGRGAGDLQDRLRAFLPKFAEANEKLERDGEGKGMEDVGEDEPHIEMNLGLGVLEEKAQGESESENSEEESEDANEDGDETASKQAAGREKDVMGKLMGGREKREGGIEEVG